MTLRLLPMVVTYLFKYRRRRQTNRSKKNLIKYFKIKQESYPSCLAWPTYKGRSHRHFQSHFKPAFFCPSRWGWCHLVMLNQLSEQLSEQSKADWMAIALIKVWTKYSSNSRVPRVSWGRSIHDTTCKVGEDIGTSARETTWRNGERWAEFIVEDCSILGRKWLINIKGRQNAWLPTSCVRRRFCFDQPPRPHTHSLLQAPHLPHILPSQPYGSWGTLPWSMPPLPCPTQWADVSSLHIPPRDPNSILTPEPHTEKRATKEGCQHP